MLCENHLTVAIPKFIVGFDAVCVKGFEREYIYSNSGGTTLWRPVGRHSFFYIYFVIPKFKEGLLCTIR